MGVSAGHVLRCVCFFYELRPGPRVRALEGIRVGPLRSIIRWRISIGQSFLPCKTALY